MKDIWEATIEMIRDAERMAREAEELAKRLPQPGQAVTYRLRAGTLRQRLALSWRVLWAGNVTIRISSNAALERSARSDDTLRGVVGNSGGEQ